MGNSMGWVGEFRGCGVGFGLAFKEYTQIRVGAVQ